MTINLKEVETIEKPSIDDIRKLSFLTGTMERKNIVAYISIGGKTYAFHYDAEGNRTITEEDPGAIPSASEDK